VPGTVLEPAKQCAIQRCLTVRVTVVALDISGYAAYTLPFKFQGPNYYYPNKPQWRSGIPGIATLIATGTRHLSIMNTYKEH
jgi:hypothetical protein